MSVEPEASPPGSATGAPEIFGRPKVTDAVTDFVQMTVDYVRQETGDVVQEKVVRPTQKAGLAVAFALGSAMVLAMGIAFISVAALMFLASFIGWVSALFAVGGVLVLGSSVLAFLKMRSIQR